MELPNLLSLRKETKQPTYLAVEIATDAVRTAIWQVVGTTAELVQQGSLEPVDPNDAQKLLKALDLSLAQSLNGVDPEPNKMVLSLPDSWLNKTEIAPDKKQILRYVAQKLDLQPVGFVITIEAIVHFLEHRRGHPPTAIVLGITSEEVAVSVVQSGRILATHTVGRSDDLGSDVEEGIARFGDIQNLPSNIVIYDGATDLEQLQQDLIEYDWQSRLPFLHIPKIDRLSSQEVIEAVIFTAGKEVINTYHTQAESENLDESSDKALVSLEDEEALPAKHEEFGFTVSHPNLDADPVDDIESEITEADANVEPAEIPLEVTEEIDGEISEEDDQLDTDPQHVKKTNVLSRLAFWRRSTKPKVPSLNRGRNLVLVSIVSVVVLLGVSVAAIAAYWYLPKAEVTLFVKPQIISRQVTFTVDASTKSIDLDQRIIPGVPIETEITATAQTQATGEKVVGDRAQGKVTIYNRTNSTKSFESGTQLTSNSGLKYTINETVNIASASTKENPDLSITTEPATAQVSITASTIGADYNLSKETEFQVANYDKTSFIARASEEISGGTSRKITAVAQDDMALLREQVNQDIEAKVVEQVQLSQQGFTGAIILSDANEDYDETFSAGLGEEATTVTLDSRVTVRSITYSKSDLSALIQNQVLTEIPDNFQLNPDDVQISVQTTDEEVEGQVLVTASAKVIASPNINPSDIATKIRGKFPKVTETYFQSQPGFQRVEIDINPKFPEAVLTFPRIQENITVNVELVRE